MKRKYQSTTISIRLFACDDLITASGEDDAIVKDGSWKGLTASLGEWNS